MNNWNTRMSMGDKKTLVDDILKARGVEEPTKFLNPATYYEEINPYEFKNMKTAVEKTIGHVGTSSKVLVVFDTDADGITSGAIVYRALKEIGKNEVEWVIGDGKKHGLGQYDTELLSKYDLIIACDSLSNEYDVYKKIDEDLGVDIIVLDHHYADKESEHAIVVNSEMFDSPNESLSGAGVAWKFVCALHDELDLDTPKYADLASVGLVADVMDMSVIDNRVICDKGFSRIYNPGIQYLMGRTPLDSEAVQFTIAPLINACNRMGENETAAMFFIENNRSALKKLKSIMEKCKREQKKEVENVVDHVDPRKDVKDNYVLTILSEDKNRHLTGLVGNKLSDKYGRPAIVLYDDPSKRNYTGSIRSAGDIPFKDVVNSTTLANSEGHQGAAGIWFEKDSLEDFSRILAEKLEQTGFEPLPPTADCEMEERDITNVLIDQVKFANRITGEGFPKISFLFMNVLPSKVTYLGKENNHTKIIGSAKNMEFLKWNDTKPVDDYGVNKWKSFDIIGTPAINNFGGKKTKQCIIDHIYYEKKQQSEQANIFDKLESRVDDILDDHGFEDSPQGRLERETLKVLIMENAIKKMREKGKAL